MMKTLRVILGDQLSDNLATLRGCDKNDTILMAEVMDEASYVKHHKKKLVFVFSAMRHFAEHLHQQGYQVIYVTLDDPDNTHSITAEVERHIAMLAPDQIVITSAGEYRLNQTIKIMQDKAWQDRLKTPVIYHEDDRFLASHQMFADWAEGRKSLRMEYFYRDMRRHHKVLMDGDKPAGGNWNYDAENRAPPKEGLTPPPPTAHPPDAITKAVINMVEKHFPTHMGSTDGFFFAVTRPAALAVLDAFIQDRLPLFGTYQDAMLSDEPWMYHSLIGLYLNIGLLTPMECIRAAETAWHSGQAPLNAVEGFIRQILGWREYVRGIYWLRMPEYADANVLGATRDLPDFYWTAETKMRCLRISVQNTIDHAYAHHIQRLMVLGNFALLAGINPAQVNEWYLAVYADAYEWVELPNVSGMTLYADGGDLASKPYAASGAYINRMSDYCKGCAYKVKDKLGAEACPFNLLYWDFLMRNADTLSGNPRMGMPYRNLARMDDARKAQIAHDSKQFLDQLK